MSSEAIVAANLANAISQASNLTDLARNYSQSAISASRGYTTSRMPDAIPIPSITVLPFTPDEKLGTQYRLNYDANLAELKDDFKKLFDELVAEYFNGALIEASDSWLLDVIQNGTLGLPNAVEDAMWQRGRDRENAASAQYEDEAMTQFAARGFGMPPGALMHALAKQRTASGDKVSQFNREVAINRAEMAIKNTQFAIEKAIDLRRSMQDFILNYVRAYMNLGDLAGNRAKTIADLDRSVWEATAQYYQSLVQVERLKVDVREFNNSMSRDMQRIDIDSFNKSLQNQTQAALEIAQTFGRMAAAYAGAQNTNASISNNTEVSG